MSKKKSLKVKPGIYEHFKGKRYLVLGTAKHSETLEDLVVYIALYENEASMIWVRPVDMFFDEKEKDGKKVKRFKFISEG
jgi:hypothetical protein